jgi:hypothetical protein
MVADFKEAPQWFNWAWLSAGLQPYEGGYEDQLVATAAIGPRGFAFSGGDVSVWATVDTQWRPAGALLRVVDDPPWTQPLIDSTPSRNAPPVTVVDPSTLSPRLAHIDRIWVREDMRTIWFSGPHGYGQHLHSFSVSEAEHRIYLSARLGTTPEFQSALDEEAAGGAPVVIPMIGKGWVVNAVLDSPLERRHVLVEGP